MAHPAPKNIKREQKKSLFFREVSSIIHRLTETESLLMNIYPTKIDFSSDMGICYVYFAAHGSEGEALFKQALEKLKLYKPSMRKALADTLKGRYTPQLTFLYDKTHEKQLRVEALLDQVQEEISSLDDLDQS